MGGQFRFPRTLRWMLLGACALLAVLAVQSADAQTTEASPMRDDSATDGGPAVELANVWMSADDGAQMQISMRVPFWADAVSQYPASETPYLVEFDVASTGIRYGAGAIEYNGAGFYGAGVGRWEFELYILTSDGFDWCRVGEITGNADIANNLLTYDIPYSMLDITAVPDQPFTDGPFIDGGPHGSAFGFDGCPPDEFAYGAPVAPCDLIENVLGRYWPQTGPSEFYATRDDVDGTGLGDETDGAVDTPYTVGQLPGLCGGPPPPPPPGGAPTTWYLHRDPAVAGASDPDCGDPQFEGGFVDNTPPTTGEADQTCGTVPGGGYLVTSTEAVPAAVPFCDNGNGGPNEAVLYLKTFNNIPDEASIDVTLQAGATTIGTGSTTYLVDPVAGGGIHEIVVPLTMSAAGWGAGQALTIEYDIVENAGAAYPRGISPDHAWGFTLDYSPAGCGGPPPPSSCDPLATGFFVNATGGAVNGYYLRDRSGAYHVGGFFNDTVGNWTLTGYTGAEIALDGCVQVVAPTSCLWESGGVHKDQENQWGEFVDPLPDDADPVFGDVFACDTTVTYKYPGLYKVYLHGTDGLGSYDYDHVWVNVLASADYDGPLGEAPDEEPAPQNPNGDAYAVPSWDESGHTPSSDRDLDGRADGAESGDCVLVPDDGTDADKDGTPDACDADLDDDGVLNAADNCMLVSNADQTDSDRDGIGDACSTDTDKDGVSDARDNCPDVKNPLQVDLDRDGVGNACDWDIDGDGAPQHIKGQENYCRTVTNAPRGCDVFPLDPSEWSDLDGDGIGDNADLDRDGDGASNKEELALGTDPDDPEDVPRDASLQEVRGGAPASVGGVSFVGISLVAVAVVLIALVLAFVLRPRR